MNRPKTLEEWHAIYRLDPSDGRKRTLWALFRNEEDALKWHTEPELYVNVRRSVRVCPEPIEMNDRAVALNLLRGLLEGPEESVGKIIQEARTYLAQRKTNEAWTK